MKVKAWDRTVDAQDVINSCFDSIRKVDGEGGATKLDYMKVRALADFGLEVLAARHKLNVDDERAVVDNDSFDDLFRYIASPF